MTAILAAEEVNPLLPHWSEIILVLIIFGLLWYLLARFVVPQFEATYAARRDAIEGGMARAEAAQAEARQALERYQAQLANARADAAQIREAARAEAQRIVEDLRVQAQEEAARIVARGDAQLQTQRSQVVRELRSEIGSLAVELSERIVGQRLADDNQVRATVDAFLTDLEAREAGGRPAAARADRQ
jgi:F-type H+-transporting ATPase subunit b